MNESLLVYRWCGLVHALQRAETLKLVVAVPRFYIRATVFLQLLAASQGKRALEADRRAVVVEEDRLEHWKAGGLFQ